MAGRLCLAYSKDLGATRGADALGCGPSILQSYLLWIGNFPFASTLEAVCLHVLDPPSLIGFVRRNQWCSVFCWKLGSAFPFKRGADVGGSLPWLCPCFPAPPYNQTPRWCKAAGTDVNIIDTNIPIGRILSRRIGGQLMFCPKIGQKKPQYPLPVRVRMTA